jgi:hypothetical protein
MFFSAFVRPTKVYHGYDEANTMIIENLPPRDFVEKLIRVDRVLSFTEDYIFIDCPGDVAQTWEYQGDLASLKAKFAAAGLMIT